MAGLKVCRWLVRPVYLGINPIGIIVQLLSENCFLTEQNMYNYDRIKRSRLLGLVGLSWFVLHPRFDS